MASGTGEGAAACRDAAEAAEAVGTVAPRDELRLGVAVTRGLLIDLLATGDLEGTTAAHERFIERWDLTRAAPPG